MESWIERLCTYITYRLDGEPTRYASDFQDDIEDWWMSTISSLIEYKTTKSFILGDLTEVVFRLGDLRVNIYTNQDGAWLNCKWQPVEPQKNELMNMAEAFVSTLKVRFNEHKELQDTRISDWIANQCKKRNLPYEFNTSARLFM